MPEVEAAEVIFSFKHNSDDEWGDVNFESFIKGSNRTFAQDFSSLAELLSVKEHVLQFDLGWVDPNNDPWPTLSIQGWNAPLIDLHPNTVYDDKLMGK